MGLPPTGRVNSPQPRRSTLATATVAQVSLVLVGAGSLLGCGGQQAGAVDVRVDTLAAGRVVVSSPDVPTLPGQPLPTLVEELRIGSLDGTCDAFGQVFSMAADDYGRIYVADFRANEIRVFSAEGECLHTFGRSGEGPGEFTMLAGILWRPPGLLWAIDAIQGRFTVFDSLGTVVATHRMVSPRSASLPWRLWGDSGGNLHYWDPGPGNIIRYGPGLDLSPQDTFRVPRLEREMYEQTFESFGNIRARTPVPHSPRIVHTVDWDGDVWLAQTSVFDLHETTFSGDTLRTVRLRRPAPQLTGMERDSLLEATGLSAQRLPEVKTVLGAFSVAPNGWIWAERGGRSITAWDVFDEQGFYVGVVRPPVPISAEPFPIFGHGTVTAVTEDALGVQYVVRLRVIAHP